MVRPYHLPLWSWNFFISVAYRALSHARRHSVRGALLHDAGSDRAEIRHGARTVACDVAGFRPAAGARVGALFHVAAFQAHTAKRDSNARTFAQWAAYCRQSEPAGFVARTNRKSS